MISLRIRTVRASFLALPVANRRHSRLPVCATSPSPRHRNGSLRFEGDVHVHLHVHGLLLLADVHVHDDFGLFGEGSRHGHDAAQVKCAAASSVAGHFGEVNFQAGHRGILNLLVGGIMRDGAAEVGGVLVSAATVASLKTIV